MAPDIRTQQIFALRMEASPAYRNYRDAIEGRAVTPLAIPRPPLPAVEKRDPPPAPPLVTVVPK